MSLPLVGAGPSASVGDWWRIAGQTCVAAYQPKSAASQAASYTNLANPGTYDAAPGVAPSWAAATGWTFNGSTQYLVTGIVPGPLPGWAVFSQHSGISGAGTAALWGMYDNAGASGFLLLQMNSNNMFTFNGGASAQYASNATLYNGCYGVSGLAPYRGGSPEANTISSSSSSTPNQDIYIGAFNLNGAATQFCSVSIQALAIYSTTLSAAEVAALSARMASI